MNLTTKPPSFIASCNEQDVMIRMRDGDERA